MLMNPKRAAVISKARKVMEGRKSTTLNAEQAQGLEPYKQLHKSYTGLPSWPNRLPIKYEWRGGRLYYKINNVRWWLPKPFIIVIAFACVLLKAISYLSGTRNEGSSFDTYMYRHKTELNFAAYSKCVLKIRVWSLINRLLFCPC